MKFTIARDDILRVMRHAALATAKRSTQPILECALLRVEGDLLTVASTDLYTTATAEVYCSTKTDGAIAVRAADFVQRIERMPIGMVHIRMDGSMLLAEADNQRHRLGTMPGDDFPKVEGIESDWHPVDSVALLRGISRVRPAISRDEGRAGLHSLSVEAGAQGATFVATDGHRLHLAREPIQLPGGGLISLPAVETIVKALGTADEAEVAWSASSVGIRSKAMSITTKLVEATFPPYQQVIPASSAHTVTVDRESLLQAIKAVVPASSEKTGGIKMAFQRNSITISAESPESGYAQDVVDCSDGPRGGMITIGVNGTYIEAALSAIGGDEVTVGLTGALEPMVIKSVDGNAMTAIVMPMRA